MDFSHVPWQDLVVSVVSAAIGWLAGWLRVWRPPTIPPSGEGG